MEKRTPQAHYAVPKSQSDAVQRGERQTVEEASQSFGNVWDAACS